MKRILLLLCCMVMVGTGAYGQRMVNLEYYTVDNQYFRLSMPPNSIALTRFETIQPAKLHEINVWFVTNESAGDSAYVVLFGKEGGAAYPYFLQPITQPAAIYIPAKVDSLYHLRFQTPLDLPAPTVFYVGVIPRGDNVFVRMDRNTQRVKCATTTGDSMYTNSFAQYIPAQQTYGFGSHFSGGVRINNWYMGAVVEYADLPITGAFNDVTKNAGLGNLRGKKSMAWADYDGDGYQDLLYGDKLMRNLGNGTFTDQSAAAGFTKGSDVEMFVDVDNDGDLDIVAMPAGYLYKNDKGVYTQDTDPGFDPMRATRAMSVADYDNDGYPDFFVANGQYLYVKNPSDPSDSALVEGLGWKSAFYLNNGEGRYTDQTVNYLGGYADGDYGVHPYTLQRISGYRPTTCAQWADYDNDGDMDLFVGVDNLQPDYLFQNEGNGDLVNVARPSGAQGESKSTYPGYFGNTTGCDWIDLDMDGNLDLFKSSNTDPLRLAYSDRTTVFRNSGLPAFSFANALASTKLEYSVYSGGAAFGDLDNDGLLDLYVASGERCFPAQVYKQMPDHSFAEQAYLTGGRISHAYSAAWVDYDNDGDLDLCVAAEDGLYLLESDQGPDGNWVELNLRAKNSNVYALGARVTVFAGGRKYFKDVVAGKGTGVQEPYTLHFGLGTATQVDSVIVRWPKGKKETIKNVAINTIRTIVEFVPDPTGTTPVAAAQELDLQQNYPNPFSRSRNASTSIGYNLPQSVMVKIDVYDMKGALVSTLVNKMQGPGTYFVNWDGRDVSGQQVPAGTYQYVLMTNGTILSKRLIVIK